MWFVNGKMRDGRIHKRKLDELKLLLFLTAILPKKCYNLCVFCVFLLRCTTEWWERRSFRCTCEYKGCGLTVVLLLALSLPSWRSWTSCFCCSCSGWSQTKSWTWQWMHLVHSECGIKNRALKKEPHLKRANALPHL